ncbi:MAG: hypothetical protein WCC81_15180 [Pseudolabrys sp.]
MPKGARLSAEENQRIEALAIAEIAKMPTRAWQDMSAVWNTLPLMHPASRRRIIRTFLLLAHKRGHALPAKWVKRFACHVIYELDVADSSRAAVHQGEKLREVARYHVHHPKASLNQIAAAIGMPKKKTTVRSWLERQDYKAFYNDELWLLQHEIEQHIQRKKEEEAEAEKNAQAKIVHRKKVR